MASLTKVGFKNFLSRQILKIVPVQVLSSHLSTTVWTPPEKLDVNLFNAIQKFSLRQNYKCCLALECHIFTTM